MTRDPTRIIPILILLGQRWQESPDLRLGQLLSNIVPPGQDIFYVEDDVFLQALKKEE